MVTRHARVSIFTVFFAVFLALSCSLRAFVQSSMITNARKLNTCLASEYVWSVDICRLSKYIMYDMLIQDLSILLFD